MERKLVSKVLDNYDRCHLRLLFLSLLCTFSSVIVFQEVSTHTKNYCWMHLIIMLKVSAVLCCIHFRA